MVDINIQLKCLISPLPVSILCKLVMYVDYHQLMRHVKREGRVGEYVRTQGLKSTCSLGV